jgi:hypothetical protein
MARFGAGRAKDRKTCGACDEVVSPVDVPATCDFNGLICPAGTKRGFERKIDFLELSNLSRAHRADFHNDLAVVRACFTTGAAR